MDRQQRLVGYELLFRDGTRNAANVISDVHATASVIETMFAQHGVEQVLGEHFGLINVNEDLLMSDIIELLPAQQIVLEILETVVVNDAIVERCAELKRMGYRLALDDVIALDAGQQRLFPYLDIIKFDMAVIDAERVASIARSLGPRRPALLAEKIDNQAQFEACLKIGMDLFQGYYFARPVTLSGRRPSPSEQQLLRLLGMVIGEASDADILAGLKSSPDLTVSLMRLVNSVASGLPVKIDSIPHALRILGRQKLQRWLQLLLFAHGSVPPGGGAPLTQLAATRGRFMELLAMELAAEQPALREKAFMVGLLSLLDVLLQQPLAALLEALHLADDVTQALLHRQGVLGRLLDAVCASEAGPDAVIDWAALNIDAERFNQCELDALAWAGTLGQPRSDD